MFIKDEAKVASAEGGVERGVVHFSELFFESVKQEFSLNRSCQLNDLQSSSHNFLVLCCWSVTSVTIGNYVIFQ